MAGFHRGNVVGLLLTPIMLSAIGFSGPFVLFSSLWLTRDSKSTLRLIQAGKTDSPANNSGQLPPLTSPLIKRSKLQGYFVLLSWMPLYINTVFNVNLKQAAWFSAVPRGTMVISGYIAGVLSDSLIKAGYSLTVVRKIIQSIGFIVPGVSLLCLNYAKTTVAAAVLIMSTELELSQPSWLSSQHASKFNHHDIAPQYAGFLHGIASSAGTLAAIISAIGTGYFVQWSGSSQAFLRVTAGLYFVTAIFWNLFATGERVF
ncbi:hypothetical protein NC651_015689 [Populus alba x Populus x berolinensis]|nr:hypothetical protein NC651_015689 [Populus alba x Populus x berolinensis]